MGLNAHVGDYNSDEFVSEHLGSYSGYNRWRSAIAKAKGFDLDKMYGYGEGDEPWDNKPFQLILNHSDCDGEYSIEQIPELLEEIKEIQKLNLDDYDQSEKFIRLCKAALKYRKPIIFA